MTTAQHPVFQTIKNFDELYQGLMECVKEGTVNRQVDPSTGLELFNYNETCSFEHKWNKYSLVARGLILDPEHKFIVAVPFPKFFNFGERECVTFKLDAPFQAYEKMDGSLGIVYFMVVNGE
jgi:RNA ligase